MKVAVFSTKSYDREYFEKMNKERHQFSFFETQLNAHTANLAIGHQAVCVFVNDRINSVTIDLLHEQGVKFIALRCAGFNNVDIEAAINAGLKVVRVPAYSPHAVAEHAVALIMALNRKTHKAYNRVRDGNFSLERLTGFDLYGKTVGVIGTGKIGQAFCQIMLGFGCKVLAYDLVEQDDLKEKGVVFTDLDHLLRESDIISLHCPLTPETHHLIKKEELLKMKEGAMLINTSRGGLINTHDVVQSLKAKHLGYLGIDVYEQEEQLFFKDLSEVVIQDDLISRLMSFPNVIVTSHQGFLTREALENIAETTLQNLTDLASTNLCENEVTLDMIKK